jgi:hypothetical protein
MQRRTGGYVTANRSGKGWRCQRDFQGVESFPFNVLAANYAGVHEESTGETIHPLYRQERESRFTLNPRRIFGLYHRL